LPYTDLDHKLKGTTDTGKKVEVTLSGQEFYTYSKEVMKAINDAYKTFKPTSNAENDAKSLEKIKEKAKANVKQRYINAKK